MFFFFLISEKSEIAGNRFNPDRIKSYKYLFGQTSINETWSLNTGHFDLSTDFYSLETRTLFNSERTRAAKTTVTLLNGLWSSRRPMPLFPYSLLDLWRRHSHLEKWKKSHQYLTYKLFSRASQHELSSYFDIVVRNNIMYAGGLGEMDSHT